MAELFQTTKQNVSLHIQNILKEKELLQDSVVKEFLTTAADGKTYQVQFYNLDVIIAVGYRVKSHRGTQFRQWATARLREYIVKGFTLDDERLKEGGTRAALPPGRRSGRRNWNLTGSRCAAVGWRMPGQKPGSRRKSRT